MPQLSGFVGLGTMIFVATFLISYLDSLRSLLADQLHHLESRIEEVLDKAGDATVSAEESENMYRLLGAHRGLSEALVNLAERVTPIDWARLRETRF